MRRDSVIILTISAVLTAAIVGGVYYMAAVRGSVTDNPEGSGTWQTLNPSSGKPFGSPATDVPAETSPGRTDTPIKCHDPESGEFWTNAATCEGADLHNRLPNKRPIAGPISIKSPT